MAAFTGMPRAPIPSSSAGKPEMKAISRSKMKLTTGGLRWSGHSSHSSAVRAIGSMSGLIATIAIRPRKARIGRAIASSASNTAWIAGTSPEKPDSAQAANRPYTAARPSR